MGNFTKIYELDDTTKYGERTLQLIDFTKLAGIKTASESLEYIKDIKPKEGKTYILLLAMSASEYYGPNRNGDAFNEKVVPGAVEEGETLPDCYKTFEDAGVYEHHKNQDITKSLGRVIKAFYNWEMHRVELLIELDNEKAKHIVTRINDGEYPPASMGCKIPYDVCARKDCRNKAPKQSDYCSHAKNLGHVDSLTGEMNYVLNPKPKLFDISFVFRPADKIAYMMKKVASHSTKEVVSSAYLGAKLANVQRKLANIKKLSEMNKVLLGQIAAVNPAPSRDKDFVDNLLPKSLGCSCQLPDKAINQLAEHPLPEAVSALNDLGITPTTIEITKIMVRRSGAPALPERVTSQFPGLQDKVLLLMSKLPELLESLESSGLVKDTNRVDPQLKTAMEPYAEKRSNWRDWLYRRIIGDVAPETGAMSPITVTAPTGEQYDTTRHAVETAQDANTERDAKVLAGTGLLAGTGYKILSSSRLGKAFSPLLLGGAALGTNAVMNQTEVPTFPGTEIPVNTELHKMNSLNDAGLYSMLAQEYLGAKPSTITSVKKQASLMLKQASLSNKPAVQFLNNLTDQTSDFEIYSYLSPFIKESSASPLIKEFNLEGFSYWLGSSLFA